MLRFTMVAIILSFWSQDGTLSAESSLCGPLSLLIVSEEFEVNASLKEINRLSGYDKIDGTTLLGLKSASEKLGLPVSAMKLSMKQLCNINEPMIAWVDSSHFLVVHECTWDGKILIQEPPAEIQSISKEMFGKRWHGETLVFSEKIKNLIEYNSKSVELPIGAVAKVPNKIKYIGVVEEGIYIKNNFTIFNAGNDTLFISTRSTCSCISEEVLNDRIPPSQGTDIIVTLDTSGISGHFEKKIAILTNDPSNKLFYLSVAGTVHQTYMVTPNKIQLNNAVPGSKITRIVKIIGKINNSLDVNAINVPDGISVEIGTSVIDSTIGSYIPVEITAVMPDSISLFMKEIVIQSNIFTRNINIFGYTSFFQAYPPVIIWNNTIDYSDIKNVFIIPNFRKAKDITLEVPEGIKAELISIGSNKYHIQAVLEKNVSSIEGFIHIIDKKNGNILLRIPVSMIKS